VVRFDLGELFRLAEAERVTTEAAAITAGIATTRKSAAAVGCRSSRRRGPRELQRRPAWRCPSMPELLTRELDAEFEVRSEPDRIIEARLLRWGDVAQTPQGPERFVRGAFRGIDPSP
jgi:hypothetical protein